MENYEIVKKIDEFKERLSELEKAINIEKVFIDIKYQIEKKLILFEIIGN